MRHSDPTRGSDPIGLPVILSHTALAYRRWLAAELRAAGGSRRRKPQRHVLILAWSFPPTIDSGVYRPASFASYGPRFGWKVSVQSGPPPETPTEAGMELLRRMPEGVRIARTTESLSPSYKLFPQLDGGFAGALSAVADARRAFADDPPAVVLASGPPFNVFVAAYYLASIFGARLAIDFRDEWTVNQPHFVSATAFDRRWERRCLAAADRAIFVTEGTRDLYLRAYGSLAPGKCIVIPNGWDDEEFAALAAQSRAAPRARNGKSFVVSFIGNLSRYNSPQRFLDTVAACFARAPEFRDQLRLQFVGRKAEAVLGQLDAFRRRFPENLELIDHLPKPAALAAMQAADAVLLLLDPQYEHSIPGKLYDYFAAGTPVLVFGETGVSANMVRELEAGVVLPWDDADALTAALRRIRATPRAQWHGARKAAWLAGRTRAALAKRLFDSLDLLVAGGQAGTGAA